MTLLIIPILIIGAAFLLASQKKPKSVAATATDGNEPPKLEAWRSQLLNDRINAYVRGQQEAEAIALAQAAFGAPATAEPAKKPNSVTLP